MIEHSDVTRERIEAAEDRADQVAFEVARERAAADRHRDALADTHCAYRQFHGWVLECLWCDFESVGKSKAEALRGMQRHYDAVLPEGCEIR